MIVVCPYCVDVVGFKVDCDVVVDGKERESDPKDKEGRTEDDVAWLALLCRFVVALVLLQVPRLV